MSRPKERNAFVVVLGGLAWPFLIGGAISCIFYALIYRGPLNIPFMHRYFTANPVLFAETYLFFVGMASLTMKLLDVAGQFITLSAVDLGIPPAAGDELEAAGPLLEKLEQLPAPARQSYLGRRLREALLQVQRKGSAEGLDNELKYLSDLDAARQQDSFGLIRIAIWATPMLGFLGTVIGITQALGYLDPKLLATNFQGTMESLLAGLYVKFDTTALALSLSTVMMFLQFLMDRVETQLLSTVDTLSNEALIGRFAQLGGSSDPHVASLERMSRAMIRGTEGLVERQVQLWQATIEAAHSHWSQVVPAAGQQIQASVGGALEQSLAKFTAEMAQVERQAADQARTRWEQWQTALSENARRMQTQQQEMMRQGEMLAQVVKATGDVINLERTLNENLKALSGAKQFEDMVMSLTAAIHLLTTRLSGPASNVPHVELLETRSKGRAA
ncbi:MAG: MotA/TolQ/ExbB proton channel family protein [Planctomycetota bacterium]|nr:MotA/TolQ/ExbB proton channel family protein [Planctomycetota bacterium]